jgi:hypothetical protein
MLRPTICIVIDMVSHRHFFAHLSWLALCCLAWHKNFLLYHKALTDSNSGHKFKQGTRSNDPDPLLTGIGALFWPFLEWPLCNQSCTSFLARLNIDSLWYLPILIMSTVWCTYWFHWNLFVEDLHQDFNVWTVLIKRPNGLTSNLLIMLIILQSRSKRSKFSWLQRFR